MALFSGCALMSMDQGQWHIGQNVNIYEPYDNSRDWGPSYLVGPPGHHFGYGSRIDDMRAPLVDRPGAQSLHRPVDALSPASGAEATDARNVSGAADP
jgi:hypothetical protein